MSFGEVLLIYAYLEWAFWPWDTRVLVSYVYIHVPHVRAVRKASSSPVHPSSGARPTASAGPERAKGGTASGHSGECGPGPDVSSLLTTLYFFLRDLVSRKMSAYQATKRMSFACLIHIPISLLVKDKSNHKAMDVTTSMTERM